MRVRRLVEQQPDRAVERRGPPVKAAFDAQGAPTQAALAFARGCGIEVAALEKLETPKGVWLVLRGTETGAQHASSLLPGIVQASLDALPIAKRMRWGAGEARVRAPGALGADALRPRGRALRNPRRAGRQRHLRPPLHGAEGAAHREPGVVRRRRCIERGRVMADLHERRETIRQGVAAAAAARSTATRSSTNALLDEVTALVEWPVPLAGRFDAKFLELPPEVPIATMQDHQRYFPVRDAQGRLMPWFVTVSNIESCDPAQVIAGNERVVRPRLTDAAFFWSSDRKHRLDSHCEALKRVTFQTQLGSLHDKTERVRALARSRSPLRSAAMRRWPTAPRNSASATCSPRWSASSRSCRA